MAEESFVGQKAHDFILRSHMGDDVTLSKIPSKNVVLIFYCADDTPG